MKRFMWKLTKWTALGTLLIIAFVVGSNWWITSSVKSKMYNDVNSVEARDVALVLGTSKRLAGNVPNSFFTHRMKATAELYHAGKIKHIIVSGDNGSKYYNEPRDMYESLIELGVPAEAITMDFAGFRTLDSVVRSKKVFQQDKIIIISQEFHNYRALFIAQYYGIDAIAYNAEAPDHAHPRTLLREYLARPKALLDLYILNKKPKFLGDTIDIQV